MSKIDSAIWIDADGHVTGTTDHTFLKTVVTNEGLRVHFRNRHGDELRIHLESDHMRELGKAGGNCDVNNSITSAKRKELEAEIISPIKRLANIYSKY